MAEKKPDEFDDLRKLGEPKYSPEDYGIDSKEDRKELEKVSGLVIDHLQAKTRSGFPPMLGDAFFVAPLNTDIVMDFTTPMGGCTNMYWGYVFQMGKWYYNVRKVSESMEVSPIHSDSYNLFVGQRQRLEGQIKQGMTSAMQAVTDYELLSHDARRYKEILDYFQKGNTDEHVLRSMFVDRVDSFTGEGYSMVTMAKRWPTIITDFIRMGKSEYKNRTWQVNEIMQELDVSQAEATVACATLRVRWVACVAFGLAS